jgi:hypothetical protein
MSCTSRFKILYSHKPMHYKNRSSKILVYKFQFVSSVCNLNISEIVHELETWKPKIQNRHIKNRFPSLPLASLCIWSLVSSILCSPEMFSCDRSMPTRHPFFAFCNLQWSCVLGGTGMESYYLIRKPHSSYILLHAGFSFIEIWDSIQDMFISDKQYTNVLCITRIVLLRYW